MAFGVAPPPDPRGDRPPPAGADARGPRALRRCSSPSTRTSPPGARRNGRTAASCPPGTGTAATCSSRSPRMRRPPHGRAWAAESAFSSSETRSSWPRRQRPRPGPSRRPSACGNPGASGAASPRPRQRFRLPAAVRRAGPSLSQCASCESEGAVRRDAWSSSEASVWRARPRLSLAGPSGRGAVRLLPSSCRPRQTPRVTLPSVVPSGSTRTSSRA
jgi:hypothetical protein